MGIILATYGGANNAWLWMAGEEVLAKQLKYILIFAGFEPKFLSCRGCGNMMKQYSSL